MADVFFTLKGVRYQLVNVDDWTFEEAAEAKRISGVPQALIAQKWLENDPDVVRAILLVSVQRVDPGMTEAVFVGEKPTQLLASLEVIEEPGAEPPDPPTASPSGNGGSGDATSTTPQTPDPAGIPAGSTSG